MKRLRDRVRPPVRVLFVGINPGTRSAAIGHHFAGYSNRFWKLLYESGLVPEPIGTEDDGRLPEWGYGITNLIPRATPGIDTLEPREYDAGLRALRRKLRRWKPELVAVVGVTLYREIRKRMDDRSGVALRSHRRAALRSDGRTATPAIALGLQPETLEGVRVFVLPTPSGRNANFSHAQMLDAYRRLARHAGRGRSRPAEAPRSTTS